jgi:hypothetical protein
MSYYTVPHLTVKWDKSLQAVVMDWHNFASNEEYRTGLNKGLELVERKDAEYWLADLREMETVAKEDQEWSNEEWFPRALETTLSHMAIIQPESVVANMSVENIMNEVGDGAITTHYFDNRDDAEEWLEGL